MTGALTFTRLGEIRCTLGESPVWDDRREILFFVDILGRAVHAIGLDGGGLQTWPMPGPPGSLGLGESGRLLVAVKDRILTLDPDTGALDPFAALPADEPATNRLNDGKTGPDGAFWVGTMDDRPQKAATGSLYRVAPDGQVARKVAGLIVANGLAFAPDGRALIHSDSRGRWIDRWTLDPASGTLADRVRLAEEIAEATGRPDGAAMDVAGNYWSAGVSAGVLNVWSPDGAIVAVHPVPVPAPTMPCFCGPDLRTLVVTSHRESPAAQAHELSGALWLATTPTAGAPVARFRDQG